MNWIDEYLMRSRMQWYHMHTFNPSIELEFEKKWRGSLRAREGEGELPPAARGERARESERGRWERERG